VILLHQTLDDYVTLFQVYEHVINPDKLRARIAEGDERFGVGERRVVVPKGDYSETPVFDNWTWHDDETTTHMWAHWHADLEEALTTRKVVERAKGVLMQKYSLTEQEAFRRIQKLSMNNRKSMKDVAEAILLTEELNA